MSLKELLEAESTWSVKILVLTIRHDLAALLIYQGERKILIQGPLIEIHGAFDGGPYALELLEGDAAILLRSRDGLFSVALERLLSEPVVQSWANGGNP